MGVYKIVIHLSLRLSDLPASLCAKSCSEKSHKIDWKVSQKYSPLIFQTKNLKKWSVLICPMKTSPFADIVNLASMLLHNGILLAGICIPTVLIYYNLSLFLDLCKGRDLNSGKWHSDRLHRICLVLMCSLLSKKVYFMRLHGTGSLFGMIE